MPIKTQNDLPAKKDTGERKYIRHGRIPCSASGYASTAGIDLKQYAGKAGHGAAAAACLVQYPFTGGCRFMNTKTHVSLNTPASHLNKFYTTFDEIKDRTFDGLIVTGAPVEDITFEEVDYWEETCKILDWAETHVTSTLHICWAAQAGFYHYYGINKRQLPQKLFGVYEHKVSNRKIPLVRGFDDIFLAPHSRHTETPSEAIHACKELTILAESEKAGVFLAIAEEGKDLRGGTSGI